MNFDVAFEKLIGHEGGYVNDARDPGGETKYGISKRAYPDEDIAGLTLERAKPIADACRWSEAIETVLATNLRLLFAWQRVALRSIWRL